MVKFISNLRVLAYRHATARQLIKFCIVGTVNTLVDFSVYIFMTRIFEFWGERLVLAAVVSYCCGMVSSFTLNNFWTFRKKRDGMAGRMPKYLMVTFASLGLNALLMYTLINLGVYDIIAKVFATGCVILWNFTLYKKWAFRE